MNFFKFWIGLAAWASVPELASVWRCVVRIASGLEREEQSKAGLWRQQAEQWERFESSKSTNGRVVRWRWG